MRVAIIAATFPPEPYIGGQALAEVARELTKRGHNVTVITEYPNRPGGKIYDGFKRKLASREDIDEFKVIRCWHTVSNEFSFKSRFLQYFTFGLSSSRVILKEGKYDVALVDTWPIVAETMNSVILSLKGTTLIHWLQDLYPESLVEREVIKGNGIIAKLLLRVNRAFFRKCQLILAISPNVRNHIIETRKLNPEKVKFIPVWLDSEKYRLDFLRGQEFRQKYNLPSKTLIATFAGNMAQSAGIDLYIQTAKYLQEREDILFILGGDGSERLRLQAEAEKLKLQNVLFISPLSEEELVDLHSASDVFLLGFHKTLKLGSVPSKQITYMLFGKPVIASVDCDSYTARIIKEADAGFVLPPNDALAVVNQLKEIAENPASITQLGENARNFAEHHFSQIRNLPHIVELIENPS